MLYGSRLRCRLSGSKAQLGNADARPIPRGHTHVGNHRDFTCQIVHASPLSVLGGALHDDQPCDTHRHRITGAGV
jgi:hypothetical protein